MPAVRRLIRAAGDRTHRSSSIRGAVASVSIRRSAHQQTRTYGNAYSGTSNPARHVSPSGVTRCPVAWTGPIRQAHDQSDILVTVNGSHRPKNVRTLPEVPSLIRGGWASTSSTLGPQSDHRRVSTNRFQTRSGGASIRRETTIRRPSGVSAIASAARSRSSQPSDLPNTCPCSTHRI